MFLQHSCRNWVSVKMDEVERRAVTDLSVNAEGTSVDRKATALADETGTVDSAEIGTVDSREIGTVDSDETGTPGSQRAEREDSTAEREDSTTETEDSTGTDKDRSVAALVLNSNPRSAADSAWEVVNSYTSFTRRLRSLHIDYSTVLHRNHGDMYFRQGF
jgi:hypothetical protein